jgi:hypothetical protein
LIGIESEGVESELLIGIDVSEMGVGTTKHPSELNFVSWEANGKICSWKTISRETKTEWVAKS